MATANLTDMSILVTDPTFQNRVMMSLVQLICTTIPGESITAATLAQHVARKNFGQQIMNGPPDNYKLRFVEAVAANQTVANEATAGGTLVGLTVTQLAAAAALCLDADINNAVASAFNSFIAGI